MFSTMGPILGWMLLTVGGLVCAINFYTSFVRYPLHRLRGGKKADFRWVSGYPLVGTLLVGVSWLVWAHEVESLALDWTLLLLVLGDTCGPHWFVAVGLMDSWRTKRSPG